MRRLGSIAVAARRASTHCLPAPAAARDRNQEHRRAKASKPPRRSSSGRSPRWTASVVEVKTTETLKGDPFPDAFRIQVTEPAGAGQRHIGRANRSCCSSARAGAAGDQPGGHVAARQRRARRQAAGVGGPRRRRMTRRELPRPHRGARQDRHRDQGQKALLAPERRGQQAASGRREGAGEAPGGQAHLPPRRRRQRRRQARPARGRPKAGRSSSSSRPAMATRTRPPSGACPMRRGRGRLRRHQPRRQAGPADRQDALRERRPAVLEGHDAGHRRAGRPGGSSPSR